MSLQKTVDKAVKTVLSKDPIFDSRSFKPRQDITAYELALLIERMNPMFPPGFHLRLPDKVARHFVKSKDGKKR